MGQLLKRFWKGMNKMGKPTGFIDYQRESAKFRPAEERVRDYAWIHTAPNSVANAAANATERKEQAGRCMACGVPFCQFPTRGAALTGVALPSTASPRAAKPADEGCPLRNQIPEWNEQLWKENIPVALERLLRTNRFPDFTGYVCPALCERACNCNKCGGAVTVNDNERFIIETAFAKGLMQPRIPECRSGKNIAVVGSGPAGLTVADMLNQRGHNVTVFERDARPGGLLVYGIPNMKLPKSVVARRINLLTEEGITFECNANVGEGEAINAETLAENYDAVVFAIGAQEPRRVVYEKDATGVVYALDYLGAAARDQLQESTLPAHLNASGKVVAVVGAGDSANDCIATALRQGACDIVQLIRRPMSDYGCMNDYAHVETGAVLGHDIRRFSTQVASVCADENGALEKIMLSTPDGEETIDAQLLIVASGFSGHQAFDVPCLPNVFCAGDMQTGASLVVKAMAHARNVAAEVDTYLSGYSPIDNG